MKAIFLKRMAVVILSLLIIIFSTCVFLLLYFGLEKPSVNNKGEIGNRSEVISKIQSSGYNYVEVLDGCGPYYDTGTCVNVRSGPGLKYPVVYRLRTGVVLRAGDSFESDGYVWYKIVFEKYLRYPERVSGDWYVAVDGQSVKIVSDVGEQTLSSTTPMTDKKIIIKISEGLLYAYDGKELFMKEPVSVGLDITPTPKGTFKVYIKNPSRYMQGPIQDITDQKYDLPGVPWNLYFTEQGAVIHGAYWHNHFGEPWSHGCVNLSPEIAKRLYNWADLGTAVLVVY